MSFRFRKGFSIFPGLRLNLSKGGISASVGKPGATLNVSKRGVRGTVSAPGTGLSYSKSLISVGGASGRKVPPRKQLAQPTPTPVEISDDVGRNSEDELYATVAVLVTEVGKASVSWLQRILKLSREEVVLLVERLEVDGIVSGPDSLGRRSVLMSPSDLPASIRMNALV